MEACKPCPLMPKTSKERADSLAEKILEWLEIAKRKEIVVTSDSISEGIERVLKEEQKITRHACAEIAVNQGGNVLNKTVRDELHRKIMNVKAV